MTNAKVQNISFQSYINATSQAHIDRLGTLADKVSVPTADLMGKLKDGATLTDAMRDTAGVERIDALHIFSQGNAVGYRFKVKTASAKHATAMLEVSRYEVKPAKDGKPAVWGYAVSLVSKLDFQFTLDSACAVTLRGQLERALENSVKSGKPLSARMQIVQAMFADTDKASKAA